MAKLTLFFKVTYDASKNSSIMIGLGISFFVLKLVSFNSFIVVLLFSILKLISFA